MIEDAVMYGCESACGRPGIIAFVESAQSCEMNGQARSLRPSPPEGTGWIENAVVYRCESACRRPGIMASIGNA